MRYFIALMVFAIFVIVHATSAQTRDPRLARIETVTWRPTRWGRSITHREWPSTAAANSLSQTQIGIVCFGLVPMTRSSLPSELNGQTAWP